MIEWFKNLIRPSRIERYTADREKMARLETAERQVADLRARGEAASTFLRDRHSRNHWREAVEQMIQGVH